jgi:hypothetical protein
MDEDEKTLEAPQVYKWIRLKENIPEIYGNVVHASWTLVDVRFRIGQLVPSGTDPSADPSSQFVQDEQAAVTIAWPYVKTLRDMLTHLVANYEKVNGEIKPINLPPTIP